MALRLGDTIPDFTQDSQLGPIKLYDFAADSWVGKHGIKGVPQIGF